MRLAYIDDGVPEITTALLREACARKGPAFLELHPATFPFDPDARLEPGDMMYRAGVSVAAQNVEHALAGPHVAAFNDPAGGFGAIPPAVLFARAGLPIPRSIPLVAEGRHLLPSHVEAVGGFPLVVKLPGGSSGIGTLLVESWPGLHSLLDYLFSRGESPSMLAFVDDAVHWRLTVVGGRAVAGYRNARLENDFRTEGSEDPADFTAAPDEALASLAVRATQVLGLEFGGVDILEHGSGRLYLLEVNFPCFFAQAQTVAGIDVAGAMLDHLIAKAARLRDGWTTRRSPGGGSR